MEKERDADRVREEGHKYVVRARQAGQDLVTIAAGDVVRELSMAYRVPSVCSALTSKRFLRENNLELEKLDGPPSGMSTTTKYTYRIKGAENVQEAVKARKDHSAFYALRGIMKGRYDDEGGPEAHLKAERGAWVDRVEEYHKSK